MKRIIDDISPKLVITTNSPRSEAAAIEIASSYSIETLAMTDLFTGLSDYKINSKNITFLCDLAQKNFIKDGLVDKKKSHFFITGNPAFDAILNLKKKKDNNLFKKFIPIKKDYKTILHADMPAYFDYNINKSYFKTREDIISELDLCYQSVQDNNAIFLIRPHPSQNLNIYHSWLENKINAFLVADLDLYTLLLNVDAIIVRSSTVGLECAFIGTKVIQLDPSLHRDMPLTSLGLAEGFETKENKSLTGLIKNVLNMRDGRYELDKKTSDNICLEYSTPKIISIINDLIKKNNYE